MPQTPPPASNQPSPAQAEAALIGLYLTAQTILLTGATNVIARFGALAAMPRLRRMVGQVVQDLATHTAPLIAAMVAHEAASARETADQSIARVIGHERHGGGSGGRTPPPGTGLTPPGDLPPEGGFLRAGRPADETFFDLSKDHGDRAAEAIARDLESQLQDVRYRLTRLPDDIYKAIAPGAATWQVRDNNLTLEQAQAAAWQEFVRRGVTGFRDRSGRDWQLSSYVEMAVRTASARAFTASAIARMQSVGIRYFTVPPHVRPCPLCGPWQGAILTIGPNPDPSVHTDGTVEEATAAGLFHPNCRDTLVAWSPSTPRPERREWTGEDQLRYDATQKQRALEREVRKAKAAEQHALTPDAKAAARRDVRAAQARVRAHLAQHPTLGRQYRREKPNLGMDSQHLTPWKPPPGPKPPYSDGSAPDWTAAIP